MNFAKAMERRIFWGLLAFALVLVVVWSLLLRFVVSGWGILATNIGFFIGTAVVISQASFRFFRPRVSFALAVVISAGIWLVIVVLIRSLILDVLGI